jgi:hypothetical protein
MADLLSLDRSSLDMYEPERIESNWIKSGTNALGSLIILGVSFFVIYTNVINIGNLK